MVRISPAVLASDRHQLLEDTVVTLETNGRIKNVLLKQRILLG